MRDMYEKEIYCCGTVRQNRKKIPKLKTDKALARGEWDWSTRRAMLSCVKRKDKRADTVSTIHNPEKKCTCREKKRKGWKHHTNKLPHFRGLQTLYGE
ncbi:hypothetical protein JTB14_035039 [Gonioctena quinquepunctata]|nr:hypothetical protein JTB14_035039 [Gonioctena quinquepunctata]